MKKALILSLIVFTVGCTPIERQAYNTFVAAKAFLDSEKKSHPECIPAIPMTLSREQGIVCTDLSKATAAKDLLIDAAEDFCAGPQFEAGGECQHPEKGTDAYKQAAAKLTAALASYNQTAADLKGVLK